MGGDDTIIGNGNTRVVYFNATSGVTVDLAAGTADGDASVGHDTLTDVRAYPGSNFGDTLAGNSGNNTLQGSRRRRLARRPRRQRFLNGGAGADTFVYATGGGADAIGDFSRSDGDRIDLSGVTGVHSLADVLAHAVQIEGGHTFIDFGCGDSLTLTNVSRASLVADDFVFSAGPNQPPVITFAPVGTNLILNGSFEDGEAFIGNADGHVAPWTLGGSVDYISWSPGGPFAWQAADGDRSLDMSGESAGSISQSFATVIGMHYTVHFSLAGNPTPELHKLQVSAGAETEQFYSFNSINHSATNMGWTDQSYTFTATSTETTLSFASIEDETTGQFMPALRSITYRSCKAESRWQIPPPN